MELYIKETGSRNADTIIFLHGSAMAGWVWDGSSKLFNDYHCIIPDLPEHGKSIDVNPFTINKSAKMIADIINDHTNNGKAHLVGTSLGAQIVIRILCETPELVDNAAISGTMIGSNPHTETLLELFNYINKVYGPVKNTDFFIKANMRTYNMPKTLFKKFKESTVLITNNSLKRILRENIFFKRPECLEEITVPVLVMTGEKDYKIIKESAIDLLKSIPTSEGYCAPNLGHAWYLENPALFSSVLRKWISK